MKRRALPSVPKEQQPLKRSKDTPDSLPPLVCPHFVRVGNGIDFAEDDPATIRQEVRVTNDDEIMRAIGNTIVSVQHTVWFKVICGDYISTVWNFTPCCFAYIGVVGHTTVTDHPLNGKPDGDDTTTYLVNLMDGALVGNGNHDSDSHYDFVVKIGDRFRVDIQVGPTGFVRFFKNDEPFGGFEGDVKGPLVPVVLFWGRCHGTTLKIEG